MDTYISDSGLSDLYAETGEELDFIEFSDTCDSLANIYNIIESYKANFDDRNYSYDEDVIRIPVLG